MIEDNGLTQQGESRAILLGVQRREDIQYYMEELEGLAEAAGVAVLGQMIQNLEKPERGTYIGKGKVEELAELAENMEADLVIVNDELSGIQTRNLEESLGIRVIDRTVLILDIFAQRASTLEGKLQVELAQLQYRLPRLVGLGTSLSRQGASMGGRGVGIGTRGPGEKKLETDRRHITKRIDDIKAEMERAKRTRLVQRGKREKSDLPIVALVGYTNAGKSAIMNRMLMLTHKEDKQVEEKDMLFATLDTRQRSIQLEDHRSFLLVDTVGFVSKLPHHLVKAFKATLEEVMLADLLLLVVDSSYENHEFQLEVTRQVLRDLGAIDKEILLVYNKSDLIENPMIHNQNHHAVSVSAKTGANFPRLLQLISEKVFQDYQEVELMIPYERGDILSYVMEKTKVLEKKYLEEGTWIRVLLSKEDWGRVKDFHKRT
ncbi:MAG TPA: GTPase HflX [Bacillota bacterium]|nr:GTPase HflX [Bacillota bacterium]